MHGVQPCRCSSVCFINNVNLDSVDFCPGEEYCWLASSVQAAQASAGAYVVHMPRSGAHRSAEDGTANKHDDQAQQRPEGHVLQVHSAAAPTQKPSHYYMPRWFAMKRMLIESPQQSHAVAESHEACRDPQSVQPVRYPDHSVSCSTGCAQCAHAGCLMVRRSALARASRHADHV